MHEIRKDDMQRNRKKRRKQVRFGFLTGNEEAGKKIREKSNDEIYKEAKDKNKDRKTRRNDSRKKKTPKVIQRKQ